VFDYLVFSENVLYKVKHFCASAGRDFDKGSLSADECVEKNVRVKLKVDSQDGFPDKNAVADYVTRPAQTSMMQMPIAAAPKVADADVPF